MRRAFFVYILRCRDGSYYTGVTNNLERRLGEHQAGLNEGAYTHDRRPIKLVYAESYRYVADAIHREKVLKAWSHEKKKALIRGDREALRLHSKKKFPVRYKKKVMATVRTMQEAMGEAVWECVE